LPIVGRFDFRSIKRRERIERRIEVHTVPVIGVNEPDLDDPVPADDEGRLGHAPPVVFPSIYDGCDLI
jgi:hypothetical protein